MSETETATIKPSLLAIIAPGVLIAATGVGAGDLATASFAGSHLGLAILWAVAVGGILKYVLTEGLARWQLATGETFLEGVASRLGHTIGLMFITVLVTAILLWPGMAEVLHGLFVPSIPHADDKGIAWTIALIGGVGGTPSPCSATVTGSGKLEYFSTARAT